MKQEGLEAVTCDGGGGLRVRGRRAPLMYTGKGHLRSCRSFASFRLRPQITTICMPEACGGERGSVDRQPLTLVYTSTFEGRAGTV